MERLNQLLAELKAVDEKIDAILAADDLTDEQRAEHANLQKERTGVKVRVDRERDRLAREDERAALEADAEKRAKQQARTVPGAARVTAFEAATPLPSGSEIVTPAPARVTIPADVRRYNPQNFKGVRNGVGAEERAYRFGQWCLAQISWQMPGRYRFPQAEQWVERHMAANRTADATGSYNLIPEEFGQDLIDLREQYGLARRLLKQVPMTSDTRTDPRRKGGLTAVFVAEGGAGTESNKVWDNVRLTAKDIMVLSRYTNQVNADASISIGDDLAGEIAYAYAQKEDDCAFNGDATSTYGGIIGARTRLDNCDGAGTDSAGLITGAGNSWSALTLANFHSVAGVLPQFADVPGAAWVTHRSFYYGVMQRLELAAGGVTARELATAERPTGRPLFLGYPVEISQVMPGATASGQVCALLGAFQLGARLGDRQQDSIAFSEHATIGGENVFERNQIAIRGTERVDIVVHDYGTATVAGPIVGLKTS